MKHYFMYLACALLFSVLTQVQAEEGGNLKIVLTQAVELGQKEVQGYRYKSKSYEPMIQYQYRFYCVLKNIGDKEVTVTTKNLDSGMMYGEEGETATATLSNDQKSYEGSQVIPSVAELGLVVLRPGECAEVRWENNSFRRHTFVKVQYNPSEIYDNRFGYWSGRVTGEPVGVMVPKK